MAKKSPDQAQGHRQPRKLEIIKGGKPAAPDELHSSALAAWITFWSSPLADHIGEADHFRLFRWIKRVDEWHRVTEAVGADFMTTGSTGQMVTNPLLKYRNDLEAQISKDEAEFGMTPLARNKLGIVIGQQALTATELNKRLEASNKDGKPKAIEGTADEIYENFEPA